MDNKIEDVIRGCVSSRDRKGEKGIGDVHVVFSQKGVVEQIDISEIGLCKKHRQIKSNFDKWTNLDFAMYFVETASKHCHEGIKCNRLSIVTYMDKVHDVIIDTLGFCDRNVLFAYINHLAERYMPSLMRISKTGFYPAMMINEDAIDSFVKTYNGNNSKVANKILSKDLESYFLMGFLNLLMEYGIVGTMNWLIIVKKKDENKVINRIVNLIISSPKDIVQKIISSTNGHNPYPEYFQVKTCEKVIDGLKNRGYVFEEKIFIDISKNSLWDFPSNT